MFLRTAHHVFLPLVLSFHHLENPESHQDTDRDLQKPEPTRWKFELGGGTSGLSSPPLGRMTLKEKRKKGRKEGRERKKWKERKTEEEGGKKEGRDREREKERQEGWEGDRERERKKERKEGRKEEK